MKTNPKVSVIMPVYNGEKYLSEAIESILNQTYRDFEFIIVDDQSNDHSIEVIRYFANRDSRIRIIENNHNLGIAVSTNQGIDYAKGEYIALMDQDDISLPERLAKEAVFLDTHPDISVVGGNSITLNRDGTKHQRRDVLETPGLIRWGLLFANQIQNPTALLRTSIFSKYQDKFENFMPSQDYHLWLNISQCYKLSNLPDVFLIHRLHESNASLAMDSLSKIKLSEIRKDFVKKVLNYDISEEIAVGLSNPSRIISLQNAQVISKIIIKWAQRNKKNCPLEDRVIIEKRTSRMLRDIWNTHNRNVILFPYVLYTLVM